MRTTLIPLLLLAASAAAFVDEDAKAIVIEEESPLEASRVARQLEVADNSISNMGIAPLLFPPLNSPCLNKENKEGKCLSLNDCYPLFKIFELSWRDTWVMGHYDTCSYRSPAGSQVFGVCCDQTKPKFIPEPDNEDEVEDLSNNATVVDGDIGIEFTTFSNCGFRTPKPEVTLYTSGGVPVAPGVTAYDKYKALFYIVNGHEAVKHEYPFMVALMNRGRQFCGGSLVDDNHILTAAHCVAHLSTSDVQHLRVRLGDHNIKRNNEANHVEKRVRRVIRHIGFSSSTLHNDVAILTLSDDVQYGSTIQPICLASGGNQFVGDTVTVAGWGTLSEGGSQPAELMKVDVNVWTNQRCKASYGKSAPGGITSHMLCAADTNRDSCSGDSGGPLFSCPPGGQCTQVGIVSWGIGCAKAQYPGVYTRITSMLPWIEKIVKEY